MAMNELLSWYGYSELEAKDESQVVNSTVAPLTNKYGTSSIKRSPFRLNLLSRRKSKLSSISPIFVVPRGSSSSSCSSSSSLLSMSPPPSTASSLSANTTPGSSANLLTNSNEMVEVNSFNDDHDDVFSSMNQRPTSEFNEATTDICSWCRKKNGSSKNYIFKTTRGHETFCSEICFSTYRRANFRRKKRCDWCRHIRNSVNYIDLQDGDNQYQFCSDKCLNQFKLDIFCQETKEHLDIHPYHRDQMPNVNDSSASLITPDMWLKNCTSPRESDKSRSASPSEDASHETPTTLPHFLTAEPEGKLVRSFNDSSIRREIRSGKLNKKNTKKKKVQKFRTFLSPRDLKKKDRSFVTSAEFPTPKISFQPNFSSMLPSDGENKQRSHAFLVRPPDVKPTPTKNFTSANLPIPPLLPINKSSEVSIPQTSKAQQTTTASTTPISPNSLLQKSNNSVLPFPTVLLPYPILLPIILPIPIPIPVPITAFKKNSETDDHDKNEDNIDN